MADVDWVAHCLKCGEIDKAKNGAMVEAAAKFHKRINPDHTVILGMHISIEESREPLTKQDATPAHRRLTSRERDRMIDLYASGPLTYIKKIDDPLFELGLLQFYDDSDTLESVEPKLDSKLFFAENGSVLPEWYVKETQ